MPESAHQFVRVDLPKYVDWGFGKFINSDDETALVTFFDSPFGNLIEKEVPAHCVRRIELPENIRIYHQSDTGAWRIGTVELDTGQNIWVRFSKREIEEIPSEELEVRWRIRLDNPTEYLANKLNESPFYATARARFRQTLIEQRGACLGMAGLISSVIDLEPHQMEVVRRVLQDPIQRYLLADEVGLGKTIEAGVVIREYVINDPRHKVLVLSPPSLLNQWKKELSDRFLLDRHIDISIFVMSTDREEEISEVIQGTGLLVIDEAHHLSANRSLYRLMEEWSKIIPRLLLLSATPVLHNEENFLEMLHLLDPVVFCINEIDKFKKLILHRQDLAETVSMLMPENQFFIENELESLERILPGDPILKDLIENTRGAISGTFDQDDSALNTTLTALRVHLSETYRLDRRILRNRRRNVPYVTPLRTGAQILEVSRESAMEVWERLEDWRLHITNVLSRRIDADLVTTKEIENVFNHFVVSFLEDSPNFDSLIQKRKKQVEENGNDHNAETVEELEILDRLISAVEIFQRDIEFRDAISAYIKKEIEQKKVVVFCSSAHQADELSDALGDLITDKIVRHRTNDWEKFLTENNYRILICDRDGEEGINLQGGAKTVIHVDLPFDPNRIEQRIGRVDRYGSGDAIQSVLVLWSEVPLQKVWFSLVNQGLGVFDQSIASLQFLLEKEMEILREKLFWGGVESINDYSELLGGEHGLVNKELKRIDQQDSLDELSERSEEFLERISDTDNNWRDFQGGILQWTCDVLKFKRWTIREAGLSDEQVCRFIYQKTETMCPLADFTGWFIGAIDFDFRMSTSKSPMTYPYTSRRQTAISPTGNRERLRILRYGDEFVSALHSLTDLDDRGKSWALWRHDPAYEGANAVDVFFCFDFLIDVDIDPAVNVYLLTASDKTVTRAAIRRRGDMSLPPFFERIWLDNEGNMVRNSQQLQVLEQPYSKTRNNSGIRDININSNVWLSVESKYSDVVSDWSSQVLGARDVAEKILWSEDNLYSKTRDAVVRARQQDKTRFAQLSIRCDRMEGIQLEKEKERLEIEEAIANKLYEGISSPTVVLDSVGAIFISGNNII